MTMNRTFSAVAAMLLIGTPALAQVTADHLAAMDANGDKKVDAAEYAAFSDKVFAKLDADGNGAVTPAEAGSTVSTDQFRAVDTNGNGSLSKAEFTTATTADFGASDLDKNGALD